VKRGTLVTRWDEESGTRMLHDEVAVEFPLTIVYNGRELVTLQCTPDRLKSLAVGFLAAEGIIREAADLEEVVLDEANGVVRVTSRRGGDADPESAFRRVITSGCGQGAAFYKTNTETLEWIASDLTAPAAALAAIARDFQRRSAVFRATGGVHSAGLAQGDRLVCFCEDIGRHNAVDKLFGECLLQGWPTADKILVTSGRVSSEVVFKVARMGVPILVSRSAPTSLAVDLARELGLTLVGFARGKRLNVYSGAERIRFETPVQ